MERGRQANEGGFRWRRLRCANPQIRCLMPLALFEWPASDAIFAVSNFVIGGALAFWARARFSRYGEFRASRRLACAELDAMQRRIDTARSLVELRDLGIDVLKATEAAIRNEGHEKAADCLRRIHGDLMLEMGAAEVDLRSFFLFDPSARPVDEKTYLTWLKHGSRQRHEKRCVEIVSRCDALPVSHLAVWFGKAGVRFVAKAVKTVRVVEDFFELRAFPGN